MDFWRPLLCHSGIPSLGNPVLIYEDKFLKILKKYSEDLVMNEMEVCRILSHLCRRTQEVI